MSFEITSNIKRKGPRRDEPYESLSVVIQGNNSKLSILVKSKSSPMQKDTEMRNDSNANEPETRAH